MKYILVILVMIFILPCPQSALAHQPQGIELVFDSETSTLQVNVQHRVSKKAYHFINKISVEFNGEEIISQKFSLQGSENGQAACYILPDVQVGDKLDVTAYCNVSGKKKETLVIEDQENPEE